MMDSSLLAVIRIVQPIVGLCQQLTVGLSQRIIATMKNDQFKAEFSERLNHALESKGVTTRARAAKLAKVTGVTSKEAARKWLTGMSVPGKGNLRLIAEFLGCREEWLEYGTGPSHSVRSGSEVEQVLQVLRERLMAVDEAQRGRLMDAVRLLSE